MLAAMKSVITQNQDRLFVPHRPKALLHFISDKHARLLRSKSAFRSFRTHRVDNASGPAR
jgi:hypothetical protein